MAALTMVKGKYKYMPLSEANVKPLMVSAFDGQNIYVASPVAAAPAAAEPKLEARFCMGNYLGGGIAGVVNEAYDKLLRRHVAVKMLNPVGYKLSTPSVLRRGEIVRKGVPLTGALRSLAPEHVFWVKLPAKRELVACYVDARHHAAGAVTAAMLKELTLDMCVALWQLDADEEDAREAPAPSAARDRRQPQHGEETKSSTPASGSPRQDDDDDLMMMLDGEERVQLGDAVYTIPAVPAKFQAFRQSRKSIYREIAHMHKLTGNSVSGHMDHGGHPNVLKLFDVLEYIQPSKSTIFLVLELAAGGELFDRIRSENGIDESVARSYFTQLLAGVLFCHQLGIVHRDLKPENLLLSDADVLKIADFGLSAHFIAAVSSGGSGVSASADDDGRGALPELDDDDLESSFMVPAARFRRLNSIVGSPHYVAPEVLQNARYGYDGRKADMWSAGVILYGLLVGSLPFGKELPTCPRYLKFCEWIRSLPCDPQTGRLVYEASIYQAAGTRIPSSSSPRSIFSPPASTTTTSSSTTSTEPTLSMTPTEDDLMGCFRPAQVHPNCQPQAHLAQPPPNKPYEITASGAVSVLPNGASSGRRGSRVVSFPSWLFPSKLSPQAVFLMASLLHPEPGKRFSCEDACRSAWVGSLSL